MEWVETTGKTIEAAREAALDQLGVAAEDAEFDIIEEPRPGLFGRMRGEARLRARVRPTPVRPKQERRRRGRDKGRDNAGSTDAATPAKDPVAAATKADSEPDTVEERAAASPAVAEVREDDAPTDAAPRAPRRRRTRSTSAEQVREDGEEPAMTTDETSPVTPAEVGAAAVQFMEGLTAAFGASGTANLEIDDLDLAVSVTGSELGLLVGPGGRTLNAIQDLARVAAQRRLGDHETRLRIDVAGYRSRREQALTAFARDVAEQVRTTGTARALEPMVSADRKVVHDALNDEEGVVSRSVGDDPDRRIVVEPA